MNRLGMIKAVFFDVDGTLVESHMLILKAFNRALREVGEEPTDATVFNISKKHETDTLEYYMGNVLGKPEKVGEFTASFVKNYLLIIRDEVELIPGVKEVWQGLRARGIKIGVLTAQYRVMVEMLLCKFGLVPDASVAREEVENKKPAPDQVLKLCEMLGVGAQDCLVVGDWTGDMEAGRRAGSRTAAVLTGICTREELEAAGADDVVEDITHLPSVIG